MPSDLTIVLLAIVGGITACIGMGWVIAGIICWFQKLNRIPIELAAIRKYYDSIHNETCRLDSKILDLRLEHGKKITAIEEELKKPDFKFSWDELEMLKKQPPKRKR